MKQIFLTIIILIFGFILWMNLTLGHFQQSCCKIVYLTDQEIKEYNKCFNPCEKSSILEFEMLKILLAKFDFNK